MTPEVELAKTFASSLTEHTVSIVALYALISWIETHGKIESKTREFVINTGSRLIWVMVLFWAISYFVSKILNT